MKKLSAFLLLPFFLISFSVPAFAVGSAGFENATFSAYSLAQGGATVAQADEPATISYNPAGITQLDGIQAQANMGFISGFTFYNSDTQGSTRSTGTIASFPTGYLTVNPGSYLHDRLSFGVGSDSPFGLTKKYESMHPIARYTGYDISLLMYTIKPVAAIKVNEKISIGAGPVYYRVFDFSAVQKYPNTLLVGGAADGQVRLDQLKGNTWGWQLGILAKPSKKHSLGFYFRSPVTVKTTGLIKVENSVVGGRFETGGSAKIDLPLNFTWAYAFKPNDGTTIEADLGFTRWSAHKRLFIDAAPVNANDDAVLAAIGKQDKDWSDSFAMQIGARQRITNKLDALLGAYFVTAAAPKDHFIPSVPDSNRLSFSVGAKYSPTPHLDISFAYMVLFNLRRRIDNSLSESLGTSVDGTYSGFLQDVVLSATYKFDTFLNRKKDLDVIEPGYIA